MIRKYIPLILVFTILISSVDAFANIYDNLYELQSMEDWEIYKLEYGLPADVPYRNSNGFPFNYELYEEKNVIVYGDYSNIHEKQNDFKNATRQDNVEIPNEGYYLKDGNKGEYRYHGQDADGLKVANDNFPRDASSSTKLESKHWVYNPWDEQSFAYNLYSRVVGPYRTEGTKLAIRGNTFYQESINSALEWDISRAVFTGEDSISDPPITVDGITDTNPYHYMAMQSRPTSYATGQGIMFHKSKYDGRAWYQTFPIPKVIEKNIPQVTAEILNIEQSDALDGMITLSIDIRGTLEDSFLFEAYSGEVDLQEYIQETYYNRKNIREWLMWVNTPLTGQSIPVKANRVTQNSAEASIDLEITALQYESLIDEEGHVNIDINATAECLFRTKARGSMPAGTGGWIAALGTTDDSINSNVKGEEEMYMNIIDFEVNAPFEILDVWDFPLTIVEHDVEALDYRFVEIEGQRLSEADANAFINGTFKFPKIGRSVLYDYRIVYVSEIGTEFYYKSFVMVYDSVPNMSLEVTEYPSKINRRHRVEADYTNNAFLEANSNITISNFRVAGKDGVTVYSGHDTELMREFLIKEMGTVSISATVSNEYGSRTYTQDLYIGDDYQPDIVAMVWNNNLARNDQLDILAEGASLDGDTVGAVLYDIYFDADKDDIAEELVYSDTWNGTTDYIPDRLGFYQIKFSTTEEFGEPTIEAHVTPEDRKSVEVTREFFVENLTPMTKIYSDIEYNFPKVEVVFLTDQDLPRVDNDYIRNNVVSIRNGFRTSSMTANVDVWDLKTYVYSQTANKRLNTGTTYPKRTVSYNANGYSGSLSRYNVDNNRYQTNNRFSSIESRQVSKSFTAEWPNTVTTVHSFDPKTLKHLGTKTTHSSPAPTSYYMNSNGYSGNLPRTGTRKGPKSTDRNNVAGTTTVTQTFTALYSGPLYKTEKYTVWHDNWEWHDNYYGDYSGEVYKNIKQSYNPMYEIETDKYIIYYASDGINNMADFNSVRAVAKDATIYLVSSNIFDVNLFIDSVVYIPYSSDTESIIDQIIESIRSDNHMIHQLSLLPNEVFTLNMVDTDPEGDPLINTSSMQYIHNPNYFDNPTGQETGTHERYDESYFTSMIKSKFSNVGEYRIIRKISDKPIDNPSKGLESNTSELKLYVHRKPIADYFLDWSFDPEKGIYMTNWIDRSYDPDFEISDPVNKGIISRKIKYRRNNGPWIYDVPEELSPGTYDLHYIVKDGFGVWSEAKEETFVLDAIPPPQILDAKLKTVEEQFQINEMPITEELELFDIQTRYPYDVQLEAYIVKNNTIIGPIKKITSSVNGDVDWEPIRLRVPDSCSDGNYKVKLVVKNLSDNLRDEKEFSFGVLTPIDLNPIMPTELIPGQNVIKATTSQYVNSLSITLFEGTTFEEIVMMNRTDQNNWEYSHELDDTIKADDYNFNFKAIVTTNPIKSEAILVASSVVQMKVDSIMIKGEWENWKRDENIFGDQLIYNPKRFLSLEYVNISLEVSGDPDNIVLDLPVLFKEEFFTDDSGVVYSNKKFTGNQTYPINFNSDTDNKWHTGFIIPLVSSSLSYEDQRLNPAYEFKILMYKGEQFVEYVIEGIEITGNVYNHIYLTPRY